MGCKINELKRSILPGFRKFGIFHCFSVNYYDFPGSIQKGPVHPAEFYGKRIDPAEQFVPAAVGKVPGYRYRTCA